MKGPDGRVLDANLALLLRHAYVPVLPRPEFRDRLGFLLREEVRRAAGRRPGAAAVAARGAPGRPEKPHPSARPTWLAAAAVVTFLVGAASIFAWIWKATPVDPGLLVARGEVALRTLDSARWEAATGDVVLVEPGLEVYTPSSGGVRLVVPDGSIAVSASSHAALVPGGAGGVAVRLDEGEVHARRTGKSSPDVTLRAAWLLSGGRARVALEEGRLELVRRGADEHVSLSEGRATYELDGERHPLPIGRPVAFGAADSAPQLAAAPLDRTRQAVANPEEETETEAEGAPAIRGVVLDGDGEPIRSFRVGLLPERKGNEFHTAETRDFESETGLFRFEGVPARRYHVYVHAAGYALAKLPLTAFDGEKDVDLGTITLTPGATVRGFVVDTATGNAVPGAVVLSEEDMPSSGIPFDTARFPLWRPASTTAASDGSFELAHLTAERQILRVSATGYGPVWTKPRVLAEGETLTIDTIGLGPGAKLEGTMHLPDGTPFVNAQLIVTPMEEESSSQMNFALATADADGRYSIEDLPPGFCLTIFLGDLSGPPKVSPVELFAGKTVTLDLPRESVGARLAGRIERSDGKPLALRNLTLLPQDAVSATDLDWSATTTDADGSYVFESVEPGSYALLEVDNMGAWLSLIDILDLDGRNEVVHDVRRPDLAIEGRSIDDATGEPIEGCYVIFELLRGGQRIFAGFVRTDADGRFVERGLPAGRYELTSYATTGVGFSASDAILLDASSPRAEHLFRHDPGTRVDVTVVDAEGAPLQGAHVEFTDERGRAFSFSRNPVTDAAGRHTAVGVCPGHFVVRASLAGYGDARTSVNPRAGRPAAVRIELKRSGE